MCGTLFYLPLYMQGVLGGSATQSGNLLTPLLRGTVVASIIGGQAIARTGEYKLQGIIGSILIAAGMVLTGGGAEMEGAVGLAAEVFKMPVRLGTPPYGFGLIDVVRNTIYATGVGLLVFGNQAIRAPVSRGSRLESTVNLWERMKHWFQGNF